LIFLWLAFEYTQASIASPLTGSYPALMLILAFFWLKERPSKMEFAGLTVTILGVLGISFY
jgi:drug/metabolite transporter (DMT)-like permease